MASRKSSALSWLFAPKDVGLNKDTNLLKLVAMVSMLLDHTGKMFFPQYQILRILGRLAFPIYAYCIAVGCVYSKDRFKYLTRILLVGLISQNAGGDLKAGVLSGVIFPAVLVLALLLLQGIRKRKEP